MWVRFWFILVALATALLSPVGCAGQGGDQGNGPPGGAPADQQDDQGDGGVPPAPDGGDNGQQAPGAPIDIPEITIQPGSSVASFRAELESRLEEACKGTVCLKIVEEARDPEHNKCEYVSTDPPMGTEVPRWSTIVIVTGTKPCDDGEGSPDGGSPGQESPSDEASPDGETSPDGEAPGEGETSPG